MFRGLAFNRIVLAFDFKERGIKSQDWALAALGVLARRREVLDLEMLRSALGLRFKESVLEKALDVVEKAVA